jgi:hypothetical protein
VLSSAATATKGALKILDVDADEVFLHPVVQAHAAKQAAAANSKIEQAGDAAHGQAAGESFEFIKPPGEIAAADQGADGGACNHRDFDPGFIEGAQNADMGPAASCAAAERQGNTWFLWRLRGACLSLAVSWP